MSDSDDCSCSDCTEHISPSKVKINKIKKYNSKTITYIISSLEEILERFETLEKKVSDIEKKLKKVTTTS